MQSQELHFVSFRDAPLLYGRVPKVANSSIKAALSKLLVDRPPNGVRIQADDFWQTQTHGETEMVSPETAMLLRDEKFCFSFVRNPFDRIVSCYHNKILDESALTPRMKLQGYAHRMPFDEFMALTSSTPNADLDVHLTPQSEILSVDGKLVPQFIGHFENLTEQWKKFRRRLVRLYGIQVRRLPTKNVRRGGDTSDVKQYFSTDALIEEAAKKYALDLELFYPGLSPDELVAGGFAVPDLGLEKPALRDQKDDKPKARADNAKKRLRAAKAARAAASPQAAGATEGEPPAKPKLTKEQREARRERRARRAERAAAGEAKDPAA